MIRAEHTKGKTSHLLSTGRALMLALLNMCLVMGLVACGDAGVESRNGLCPDHSTYDSAYERCFCDEGFVTDEGQTACVKYEADNSNLRCPENTSFSDKLGMCECDVGYVPNDTGTGCLLEE